MTEHVEQMSGTNASLINDCNKRMLALAPRVHLLRRGHKPPPQLQPRRDLVRRQMWLRMVRPTSRKPEVLMSDKAQPLDVPPSRLPIL